MHKIIIQKISHEKNIPSHYLLRKWANAPLNPKKTCEVTLRIIDKAEMTTLNTHYRNKKGPTNVLSFPFQVHKAVKLPMTILGDVLLCAEVIADEAKSQHKDLKAHWAHLTIHGIFHLLGYDHQNDKDAAKMENAEIKVLQSLGFPNPYIEVEKSENANE